MNDDLTFRFRIAQAQCIFADSRQLVDAVCSSVQSTWPCTSQISANRYVSAPSAAAVTFASSFRSASLRGRSRLFASDKGSALNMGSCPRAAE